MKVENGKEHNSRLVSFDYNASSEDYILLFTFFSVVSHRIIAKMRCVCIIARE
jgi:hypothetical protein